MNMLSVAAEAGAGHNKVATMSAYSFRVNIAMRPGSAGVDAISIQTNIATCIWQN